MDLMETLTGVFRSVFDDDSITLSRTTSANDIEAWDSLSHVNLMLAVENAFQIEFNQKEVRRLKNVGELADLIQSKLAARAG